MKVQLGALYVMEVLAPVHDARSTLESPVPGYALFDMNERQLSIVFTFFGDVLAAASAMGLA